MSNHFEEVTTLPTYNINNLPNGRDHIVPERIVCAANRYGSYIIPAIRHADKFMHDIVESFEDVHVYLTDEEDQEQGFLTNKFRFVNRQEAWKIAAEQQQIVCRVGGDSSKGGTLYSENLY